MDVKGKDTLYELFSDTISEASVLQISEEDKKNLIIQTRKSAMNSILVKIVYAFREGKKYAIEIDNFDKIVGILRKDINTIISESPSSTLDDSPRIIYISLPNTVKCENGDILKITNSIENDVVKKVVLHLRKIGDVIYGPNKLKIMYKRAGGNINYSEYYDNICTELGFQKFLTDMQALRSEKNYDSEKALKESLIEISSDENEKQILQTIDVYSDEFEELSRKICARLGDRLIVLDREK